MTEWYRPNKPSLPESSPWRMEGDLREAEPLPDRSKVNQGLAELGLGRFSGQERTRLGTPRNTEELITRTEAEMRQFGRTDDHLAYQAGAPRSPLRGQPDRSRRPPRARVDDEDFSQVTYLR